MRKKVELTMDEVRRVDDGKQERSHIEEDQKEQ